jgi:hypothetical protein
MTIFYRGPYVRITHEVFENHSPTYRSFVLADLRRVRVVVPVAAGARWWSNSQEQALVALYRGEHVTLYQNADPLQFGQVRRALMRAMERLDDTY